MRSRSGPSLVPDPRLTLIDERFSQMDRVLAERGMRPVDGIALDIGVSSMQLDQAERGFSFLNDGPLDMRMSQSGQTAAEFLNDADEAEIARVLKEYGEEPRARAVARAIVAARPSTRPAELAAIVRQALGYPPGPEERSRDPHLPGDPDPFERRARRAGAGACAPPSASLRPGGRLAVVTFHSLEDRIVKRFLTRPQRRDARRVAPSPDGRRRAPHQHSRQVAKPVSPSEAELARNPRARSARLRTAVRTVAPAWRRPGDRQ